MGIHDGMLRQNVACFYKMWRVMEQTEPMLWYRKPIGCLQLNNGTLELLII